MSLRTGLRGRGRIFLNILAPPMVGNNQGDKMKKCQIMKIKLSLIIQAEDLIK